MSARLTGFSAALVLCTGCGSSDQRPPSITTPDATVFDLPPLPDSGATDTAAPPLDAPLDAPVDAVFSDASRDVTASEVVARSYPGPPYGTFVGNNFEPFNLTDCNNRPYLFAGPEFVNNRATLVILNAGYSTVGRAMSADIQAMVEVPYRGHAIRVVEVLVEGASVMEPATNAQCQAWVDSGRLGHTVLIDPTTMLSSRVPMRMYPIVYLLDENARIVWLSTNGSTAAAEARQQLAMLIGEP